MTIQTNKTSIKTYYIKTFGCVMNYSDSEKINMLLLQSGFKKINDWKNADLIIFNTCSVRKKGEDRVFGLAREIIREREKLKQKGIKNKLNIAITGCMVKKTGLNKKYHLEENLRKRARKIEYIKNQNDIFNSDDKLFPRLEGLDFVFRIEEIKYLTKILSRIYATKIGQDDKFDDYLKVKQLRDNPSSASIVIQTGCDNFCKFCIVPYTRGREISRTNSDIISEIKEAVKGGAKEITLVGQNVNSYGKQQAKKFWDEKTSKWTKKIGKSPFRELLEKIDDLQGIDRLRFTSSNPHDMTLDILDSHFDLKTTCNYLHFALQSGSDSILKHMNRKHSFADFKKMVDYLRSKDPLFSISTDIIVGYPGETEEDFLKTKEVLENTEFDFAYIARYSERPGTIASKIFPDTVTEEQKSKRWHILNDILKKTIIKRNKLMLGKIEEIMVYGTKKDMYFGRTRNFKEVFFESDNSYKKGEILKVKLKKLSNLVIIGEVL